VRHWVRDWNEGDDVLAWGCPCYLKEGVCRAAQALIVWEGATCSLSDWVG